MIYWVKEIGKKGIQIMRQKKQPRFSKYMLNWKVKGETVKERI